MIEARSNTTQSTIVIVLGVVALAMATGSHAQTMPGWGRISLMGQFGQQQPTTGSGGLIVETRPETVRYSVSSSVNLSRSFSLMLSLERLTDKDTTDDRGVAGITYRF